MIADAEWLNPEAQNALLRTLEEPPPRTTLVLVTASAGRASSRRCARAASAYAFPAGAALDAGAPGRARGACARWRSASTSSRARALVELLDWAEEYRGVRAEAAAGVARAARRGRRRWLHRDVRARAAGADAPASSSALDAFATLQACRKALVQRNANPQIVAERALLALREALA